MIPLISGGRWIERNETWKFDGKVVAKAIVMKDSLTYQELVAKIMSSLNLDACLSRVNLSYMSPRHPNLPPFNIGGDEDLEGLKFLNFGMAVWETPIHCLVESTFDLKAEVECVDLTSGPPLSSPQATGNFSTFDRKRKSSAFCDSSKASSSKATKPKHEDVISLSSDEEDNEKVVDEDEEEDVVVISSVKHKGVDVYNLSDDDDIERLSDDDHSDNFRYDQNDYEDINNDQESSEFLDAIDSAEREYLRKHRSTCPQNFYDLEGDNGNEVGDKEIVEGMVFETKSDLQSAIKDYALKNCFEAKVKRSEPERLVVVCKEKTCSFSLSASANKGVFVVRKLNVLHTCGLLFQHDPSKQATATYIAEKVLPRYDIFLYFVLLYYIPFEFNFIRFMMCS